MNSNKKSDLNISNNNNKYIKLRPLVQEDVKDIFTWHNDYEVTKYSMTSFIFPQTIELCQRFISEQSSNKMITLGILYKERLVGYIGISRLDWINRSGEYFILIGDKKSWGKSIGFFASKYIIKYGFESLGLNRIDLTVSNLNKYAISLYKKLGFVEEGIKKEACFRDGEYHDKVLMALLLREWSN